MLAHAVRHADELAYGETICDFAQQHGEQFCFVPFVSREDMDFALRHASRKQLPMTGLKPRAVLHLRRKVRK